MRAFAGSCRITCGEPKSDELLRIALVWLKELEDETIPNTTATNPHKLMRTLEVFDILTCSQMIIQASLARKASSTYLGFVRSDYPELDPPIGTSGLPSDYRMVRSKRENCPSISGGILKRIMKSIIRHEKELKETLLIRKKVYATPNAPAPTRPVIFNPDLCIGCNTCVEVCQMDVFIPNPEKGEPPIILYPTNVGTVGVVWPCALSPGRFG